MLLKRKNFIKVAERTYPHQVTVSAESVLGNPQWVRRAEWKSMSQAHHFARLTRARDEAIMRKEEFDRNNPVAWCYDRLGQQAQPIRVPEHRPNFVQFDDKGSWTMLSEVVFRFKDDRDATLFKLFWGV